MMGNDEPTMRLPKQTKAIIACAIALLVAAFGIYAIQFGTAVSKRQEVWGQFGDYLGGVLNPIFGLGGFIALLLTLHHQKTELKKTTEQNKQQHEILEKQGFESTYCQLLGLYQDVLSDLRMTRPFVPIDNPHGPGEVIGRGLLSVSIR